MVKSALLLENSRILSMKLNQKSNQAVNHTSTSSTSRQNNKKKSPKPCQICLRQLKQTHYHWHSDCPNNKRQQQNQHSIIHTPITSTNTITEQTSDVQTIECNVKEVNHIQQDNFNANSTVNTTSKRPRKSLKIKTFINGYPIWALLDTGSDKT